MRLCPENSNKNAVQEFHLRMPPRPSFLYHKQIPIDLFFICTLFNSASSGRPLDYTVLEDAGIEPVPEFIDPVFAKTSSKRSFSIMKTSVLGLFPQLWH
jgi:hypothetical protein